MIDVVDKVTRSRMMAGIRGKDTKPEKALRQALHRKGLRYRLHVSGLPGRPDILLPRHQAAIQVHGCFWHRHEQCAFCTTPADNSDFWGPKFRETMRRDKQNVQSLRKLGWRVAIVWECSLRDQGPELVAQRIVNWLQSSRTLTEISSPKAKAKLRRKLRKS